jgi:hypothetical protein
MLGLVVGTDVRLWTAAAALVALGLVELTGRADLLPQNRRLVPQTILASDSVTGPLQFGFEMGTGLRTFAPSALPWALVVLALLWAPMAADWLAIGLGFGLGRSLVLPARRRHPDDWDRRLSHAKRPIAIILATPFGLIAAALLRG